MRPLEFHWLNPGGPMQFYGVHFTNHRWSEKLPTSIIVGRVKQGVIISFDPSKNYRVYKPLHKHSVVS